MADPSGYFISFRCYGTWLHGDPRGSVDPLHNRFGDEPRPPEPALEAFARQRMTQSSVAFTPAMRGAIGDTIREVCDHRDWYLVAESVRTDHVHVVLSAPNETPERVMNTLKSWSTRRLREAGLLEADVKSWSRHGSTRYLWSDDDVEWAAEYVRNGQDVPWDKKQHGWR